MNQKNSPRVAIIYLCYNAEKYVEEVVSAFADLNYQKDRLEILFVLNASPDGTEGKLKNGVLPRYQDQLPAYQFYGDNKNLGFAGGNNAATQYAIDQGFDYVFLNNGDLKLHKDAIRELVNAAEADLSIGSAQSLVYYWNDHEKVNVSGGVFHIAGYAYAKDNLKKLPPNSYSPVSEITYSSGAAVLYRTSALKKVGLLEEGFFMYHEDVELGLRLKLAGYKNVLAAKSLAYHDYQFARNPKKFAWMELYRWVVVLAYYKVFTLILLAPLLVAIELGTWLMAAKGGWLKAKIWQYQEAFKPRTWKLVASMRKRANRLRVITDGELIKSVTGTIEADSQEQSSWILERFANPVIETLTTQIKKLIRW